MKAVIDYLDEKGENTKEGLIDDREVYLSIIGREKNPYGDNEDDEGKTEGQECEKMDIDGEEEDDEDEEDEEKDDDTVASTALSLSAILRLKGGYGNGYLWKEMIH